MSDKFWYKVAKNIMQAGQIPLPITHTFIEFLQTVITEDQAKFLLIYNKSSLNIDQIKDRTDLDDDALNKMLDDLMNNGIIMSVPSEIYRLNPPLPGIIEFSLMRGITSDKYKRLAKLVERYFDELGGKIQQNYESISKVYTKIPAFDRIIPVGKEVEVGTEVVLPYEDVEKYLEKFGKEENNIAVGHCYCRHSKDLLNDPCKLSAPKLNCVLFDKAAKFAIEHNFASPISKEEALKIFREAEDYGLVHRVFHEHFDLEKGIDSICNCCSCCCGIFGLYHRGVTPLHTISSYISRVSEEDCVGCGTCVEKCPMEAIDLEDSIASVNEEFCIGCGICAHHCPEEAIHLERIGPRDIFIPLKKIATN